jgi:predicted metalloprotease
MVEREVIRERPAEREVVVDDRPPRGGGGGGGLIAAIVGVILVLIIGWFLLNALGVMGEAADNAGESGDVNAEVEVPDAEINVDGEGGGE